MTRSKALDCKIIFKSRLIPLSHILARIYNREPRRMEYSSVGRGWGISVVVTMVRATQMRQNSFTATRPIPPLSLPKHSSIHRLKKEKIEETETKNLMRNRPKRTEMTDLVFSLEN